MIRRCNGCSAEMDPDAIFCNECGHAQTPISEQPRFDASPAKEGNTYQEVDIAPTPTVVGTRHRERPPIAPFKHCPRCRKELESSVNFCSGCSYSFVPVANDKQQSTPVSPGSASINESGVLHVSRDGTVISEVTIRATMRRYSFGYAHARMVDGFGVFAIIVGIIVVVVALMAGVAIGGGLEAEMNRGILGGSARGTGVVLGVLIFSLGLGIGGVFFLFGMLFRAEGQRLKASFDSAVNSSPFLTDIDRAKVMSLPFGDVQKKNLNYENKNEQFANEDFRDSQIEFAQNQNFKNEGSVSSSWISGIRPEIASMWSYLVPLLLPIILFYTSSILAAVLGQVSSSLASMTLGTFVIAAFACLIAPQIVLLRTPPHSENSFVRFHAYQSLILIGVFIAAQLVSMILLMFMAYAVSPQYF